MVTFPKKKHNRDMRRYRTVSNNRITASTCGIRPAAHRYQSHSELMHASDRRHLRYRGLAEGKVPSLIAAQQDVLSGVWPKKVRRSSLMMAGLWARLNVLFAPEAAANRGTDFDLSQRLATIGTTTWLKPFLSICSVVVPANSRCGRSWGSSCRNGPHPNNSFLKFESFIPVVACHS